MGIAVIIVLKSKNRESSCLKKACKFPGMVLNLKDPDLKWARYAIFVNESDSSISVEKSNSTEGNNKKEKKSGDTEGDKKKASK